MSVLLIDIGNTSVTLGISRGSKVINLARLKTAECTANKISDIIRDTVRSATITGAALCSVAPLINKQFLQVIKKDYGLNTLIITHDLNLGVNVDYPEPTSIGADRLANAAGAVDKYGCPVIVADFGTALTFDIISEKGAYVGGIITPGLPLMADYFSEKTALLPHIDLKGGSGVIGKSTIAAMRIGAKLGYRGMVKEIVTELKKKKGLKNATLCATGGYAKWVLANLDIPFEFDKTLTLYGILKIYGKN
ncbi:MAG: type III pantothenate kinase [Kiritimatiellae bacterium]|nr:type III pantothenate kinase [Kiritimatiellia bacterium]